MCEREIHLRCPVEAVVADVPDDGRVDEVAHGAAPAHGQPHLGRADVRAHVRQGEVDILLERKKNTIA